MTFIIKDRSWGTNFPSISLPKVMGYFSVDNNRQISFDSSQLKYYCPPPITNRINFDLNHGINLVRRKPISSDNEKIDHLLRWINYRYELKSNLNKKKWLDLDFVLFRGLMTKIIKTPYDVKEGWIICAVKFKGTIYMCGFDTEADKYEKLNRSVKNKQFMSWGFKFEQYVVSDTPNKQPDVSKPVEEGAEFCCIFKTHLMNHHILYGAEMDGIISDEVLTDPLPMEKLKFIEFKTSRIVENPRQLDTLKKFKFLRWWGQSFLVGIETLVCGFRDDKGIVRKIEKYSVSELAKMSKQFWSAAQAMNFCDVFLKYIAQTVIHDYDQTIYKFEREPWGDITMTELPPSSEYSFLPQWYTQRKN